MIYDCFTFRDEFDMLEIRLRILDRVVDKFVICEADRTFTNQPKPYNFLANKDRFKQWEDKIIYLPVELNDEGLDFSKNTLCAKLFKFFYDNNLIIFDETCGN